MKMLVIKILDLYQKIISPILKQALGYSSSCRFYPTCSQYAKIAVQEKGVIIGFYYALMRLLKCQPFYNISKI